MDWLQFIPQAQPASQPQSQPSPPAQLQTQPQAYSQLPPPPPPPSQPPQPPQPQPQPRAHDARRLSLDRFLLTTFGFPSFREGQSDVVEATLDGRDTFVLWATGVGKSLCYQFPVLWLNDRASTAA